MNNNFEPTIELAEMFADMLADNEECMGEHAAFLVTCEQMEIDEMDGYELLSMLSDEPT